MFPWSATKPRLARSLDELYADPALYRSSQDLLPPSEKLPHVLRFELTEGCSWGRCTYCTGFDHLPFRAKTTNEFQAHVEAVMARIGHDSRLAYQLKRIFIGGGNALAVPTEELRRAIAYAGDSFANRLDRTSAATRIALYGTTKDINAQGRLGIGKFYCDAGEYVGLGLIYWGVESGSDKVLKFVCKGDSKKRQLQAAEALAKYPIRTSVMIMPGLGGTRFSEEHVRDTAEVLSAINPTYITFLGINAARGTSYARTMADEERAGQNRLLSAREKATEMVEMIEAMKTYYPVTVGCFESGLDRVGKNPLTFGSRTLSGPGAKQVFVEELRAYLRHM